MSRKEDFMDAVDHFAFFVSTLPLSVQKTYHATKHVRVETGFLGRNFVIYEMDGHRPRILDEIIVEDFECSSDDGASSEVKLLSTGAKVVLRYQPVQMFNYPLFMWLPLAGKVRWGAPRSAPLDGSLGFPIALRTLSRQGLREKGVVHCETGPDFGAEFNAVKTK